MIICLDMIISLTRESSCQVKGCCGLLCFCARLFNDALWSPAGKGLASWLSFVMSNCEFVTFPFLSWVRCGA